jgi:hypothetical protein
MGFDTEDAEKELQYLVDWYEELPDKIKLYRIVQVDNKKDIDLKKPGSHYSTEKQDLLSSNSFAVGYGEEKYLITIIANKTQINIDETFSNRINHPNENEITLKNKGEGSEIISIKKIKEDDDDNIIIKSRRTESLNLVNILKKLIIN